MPIVSCPLNPRGGGALGCDAKATAHLAAGLDIKRSNAALCAHIQMEVLGANCIVVSGKSQTNSKQTNRHSHREFGSGGSISTGQEKPRQWMD